MDISFVDYDSVRFHLSTPTRKTLIHLSMATPCWTSSLLPLGSLTLLQSLYPSHLLPSSETEDSFDVTLAFDLEAAPGSPHAVPEPGEEREALIREVAMIKPRALSAPFERAFEQQRGMGPKVEGEREEEGELMTIQYREDEAIYIKSSSDRVTVVFSTTFKDETDRVFGRVFLQVSPPPFPIASCGSMRRGTMGD
jgi:actin related protein 2/3 complex subunit 2